MCDIYYAYKPKGGEWSALENLTADRDYAFGSGLAIDSSDTVHLLFVEPDSPYNLVNAILYMSKSPLSPWAEPVVIASGPPGLTRAQSWVTAGPDNVVHIAWSLSIGVRHVWYRSVIPDIPSADSGGPYTVPEGGSTTLEGSGFTPSGGTLTYAWDLDDDGVFETPGRNVMFSAAGRDGLSSQTVVLRVCNTRRACATSSTAVAIINKPPTLAPPLVTPEPSNEGDVVIASAAFSDPSGNDTPFTCTLNYGDGSDELAGTISDNACTGPAHIYSDNSLYTVTILVADKDGLSGNNSALHEVKNLAPEVTIAGPPSGSVSAVGTLIAFEGIFADPGIADTHACRWEFDTTVVPGAVAESDGSGSCSANYTFTSVGVYRVKLIIIDDDGGVGEATTVDGLVALVVVYDPEAGFVVGGGWIQSPVGAYAPDPALSGKATFGFNSAYRKGATVPTGQTEFHFRVANFNFYSDSYDWLVVAGARAQFKGSGTVNGTGHYGFMLTAIDGQIDGGGSEDMLRIKIWEKASGEVVYDNQMGMEDDATPSRAIGGGSIMIHKN